MKLLIDCHVFDGKFQGTRTYIEGLYTHLTHHDDIEFYFAAKDKERLKIIFGERPNIHYIPLKSESSILRLAYEFPSIIKDYGIDYAHFQYVSPLKKYCKEIVTIHDLLFLDYPQYFPLGYRLKNKWLFNRSSKRADLLLTVSDYSKREITKHFGIVDNKIHITYNSVLPASGIGNIDVRTIYGLRKYILTVGRIEPRKNYFSLLKAYINLGLYEKGYDLVIVGVRDLSYKLFENYYKNLSDLQKKSIFLMSVPFSHLVELYRHCSLFVFPSFAEGFGIPPLEAIEYGCPLLCSNATAMGEFPLDDNIMFNPGNQKEFEQKLLSELSSPTDMTVMRERIRDKYDWQSIANHFYQLLTEIKD